MHQSTWIVAAGLLAIVAGTYGASIKNSELADYQCKDNSDYKTYDPNSCSKYIECNNGVASYKSCGYFHRFDEKTNTCIFHFWLIGNPDCSMVVVPTAAPTKGPNPTGTPTGSPNKPTDSPSSNGTPAPTKKANGASVNSFSLSLGLFFLGVLSFLC